MSFLPLIVSAALAATPPHEQAVAFGEQHDPNVIELADGRRLQVRYDGAIFDDVFSWSSGRPMVLTYLSDRGMALIDTASGAQLTVHTVSDAHLLDVSLSACMDSASTTVSIHDCQRENIALWSAEVTRLWGALAASRPESASALQQSQAAWQSHRDAQFKAISAVYSPMQGTMWGISAGRARLQVIRAQGLQLGQLLADADIGS